MKKLKVKSDEETREETAGLSRRSVLLGSATLLVGGIAGCLSNAAVTPEPTYAPPPPLPWKWVKLDPMEAGTRTYQAYLKQKG